MSQDKTCLDIHVILRCKTQSDVIHKGLSPQCVQSPNVVKDIDDVNEPIPVWASSHLVNNHKEEACCL